MEKAKEKGIPVVLVDQGIAAGHEDLYLTFVSTDNKAAAKVAGEYMVEQLGEEGGYDGLEKLQRYAAEP